MDFGIIGEGNTDQTIIDSILQGFCNDKNLNPTWLQPTPDTLGNWDKVFRYVQSDDFRQAFAQLDFVVVHLDSDVFGSNNIDEKHRINLSQTNPEETVGLIRELLIQDIGLQIYEAISNRIIFAIAVDQTECWLLPIFFPNQKAKAKKTSGCISTLNEVMNDVHGFYIDTKDIGHYRTMSKPFLKKKDLTKFGEINPSLSIFLTELEEKTRNLEPEIIDPAPLLQNPLLRSHQTCKIRSGNHHNRRGSK